VTLRRDTIVTALAALVIVAAIPFAIVDTIGTGRVYLFSWQFLEELPRRFTGPGRWTGRPRGRDWCGRALESKLQRTLWRGNPGPNPSRKS
jgi:hypothetical protein